MKTFKFLISVIILAVFTSCEDVIQVKLDEGEPILTVDAFVNDMRLPQKVRLTYADGYFSQTPNTVITGATVSLRDLSAGVDYIFNDNNNGDYIYTPAVGDTFRVGHEYELTVTHQGNTFKSYSRIKRTAQVDSLNSKYVEGGGFSGAEPGYRFTFFGIDMPGDTIDYYWIKPYRNGVFFNKGGDILTSENAGYGVGTDGFPFITPIAEGITPFGERYKLNDVCRLEIHSINLETYNFLSQVYTQTTNSGLFATSPENVKTNIKIVGGGKTKVVGWFCMSAVGFKEAIAQ